MPDAKFLSQDLLKVFAAERQDEIARESIRDAFAAAFEAVSLFTGGNGKLKWIQPRAHHVELIGQHVGLTHALVLEFEDGDAVLERCTRTKTIMLVGWDEIYPVKLVELIVDQPKVVEVTTQDDLFDNIKTVLSNPFVMRLLHRAKDFQERQTTKQPEGNHRGN